jgi:hypothetical protein
MGMDLQQMTRDEKLKAMHAIWEDLAKEDEAIESPEWHGEALRETEARVDAGTERVHDWEQAKRELRRRAQ